MLLSNIFSRARRTQFLRAHFRCKPSLRAVAVLSTALVMGPAQAADRVTDAVQAAYGPYRTALFQTNGKSAEQASQAVAQAAESWKLLAARFVATPPAPYDRDGAFADTLRQVTTVYARADSQVQAGQLQQAHETLEQVRDLLAELRQRNGVVVYSDHMNAYHQQMEHVLNGGAKTLAAEGGMLDMAAQVGVLDHLAEQLRLRAGPSLAGNGEFTALLQAVQDSVAALRLAVQRQDEAAVRAAIGKLKSPYSRLFLKFG